VVQKPRVLKATKNLDMEALFAKTKILNIDAEQSDDQLVYRLKVQDGSSSQRVDKLMDYLRNRGCNVSVITRTVAEQTPVPPADPDLATQLKPERIVKNTRNAASARVKLLVARNMN